jgi:hypothetical protein
VAALRPRIAAASFLVSALVHVGCSDPNTLESGQVVEVNLLDRFEFEATGLDNVTDTRSRLFTITGTQATVDVTAGITAGSARLQLRDPAGAVVYSEFIEDEVDGLTDSGGPGLWQVDIVLSEVTGEFSFTLERAP